MRFSKFWNTFPKVSKLTAWISWCIASLSCSIVRGVFLYTLPFSRPPKERSRQALDRLPLVSNFLTNFWMRHFDGARLSPNSVRNAVWHALNEPVCQYLRTINPRCSTVCMDSSLGLLARDSPCSFGAGLASASRPEPPARCCICCTVIFHWHSRHFVRCACWILTFTVMQVQSL